MVSFGDWKKTSLRYLWVALVVLLSPTDMNATALFQPVQAYRSGAIDAADLAVGDLNGDGKPDLLVANSITGNAFPPYGAVGVLLGNGDGTFQTARLFDTGSVFAGAIAVADVNGDGNLDAVVAVGGTRPYDPSYFGKVSVLLGNGKGSFEAPQMYTTGGYAARDVDVGDVNGDGRLDLLVANGSLNPDLRGPGALGVLLGNGDGTFGLAQTYSSQGGYITRLAVGDVNADGNLDVAIQGGVLLGNGDGTFQPMQSNDSFGAQTLSLADVNGDGNLDLLAAHGVFDPTSRPKDAVGVLLGNGDGTFQEAKDYSTSAAVATSVAVTDVNGDGDVDLLVAHTCIAFCNRSPVAVLLGNGDGTFKTALRYYSGGRHANSIVAADVNADSKPDLLAANECVSYEDCSNGSVGVLLGMAGVRTATSVSSSSNPSIYGQSVTLTATVNSVGPSIPTGTVRYLNGTTGLGYASLVGGVATLTKTNLPAGTMSITVKYNGDTDSAKSTSAPLSQILNRASTTTTIKSSSNPSTQGQPVTFTATVSSPTAFVTGAITFKANGEILGTVPLVGQNARIMTSMLPLGENWVTAFYTGTSNFVGSKASLTETLH